MYRNALILFICNYSTSFSTTAFNFIFLLVIENSKALVPIICNKKISRCLLIKHVQNKYITTKLELTDDFKHGCLVITSEWVGCYAAVVTGVTQCGWVYLQGVVNEDFGVARQPSSVVAPFNEWFW